MLQLLDLRKSYTTAGFTQNALDGVSVAFRDNEFAAILGPSGSGKTTMLNIIGGLDQCDSGDLKIDDISTKQYKDRDWDTYRNNRIGFVFQSYNLIPHQSVLSNVELALTLSGVSSEERKERAKNALIEVGLTEHIKKKPNQLSGGQMQRVAIARALVNDPEILLADEPTGAVDSETSLQIMNLLTKIAHDRLVIMVTHNNELAEKYANRIINLKDGKVIFDSNPFDPAEEQREANRYIRKSSMSFFTAISLSFSNLMTKKGRTFVTSLAGSIGIIGIATILALANGINMYIQRIEEETLSLYPLMIQSSGIDLSSMFSHHNEDEENQISLETPPNHVREHRVVESVFSSININDLESLKTYFEEENEEIQSLVTTIHYKFDVTPQIFLADTSEKVEQVNPEEIFAGSGMGAPTGMANFGFSGMGMMNMFSELPNELSLFENQYEVLAGRWPENYDEVVLVLSGRNSITDFAIYTLGLRDRTELSTMLEAFMSGSGVELDNPNEVRFFSYETLMAVEFKVINPADVFRYDEEFGVWVDRSGDIEFKRLIVDNGLTLRIVGIVRADPGSNAAILSSGINYTPELIYYLVEQAGKTQIVRDQRANPDVNIFTGRTFEDELDNPRSTFDFSRIISVDEEMIGELFDFDSENLGFDPDNFDMSGLDFDASSFNFNPGSFNIDLSSMDLNLSNLDMSSIPPPQLNMSLLAGALGGITLPVNDINNIMIGVLSGFFTSPEFLAVTNPLDPAEVSAAFAAYMAGIDMAGLMAGVITQDLQNEIAAALQKVMMEAMTSYMTQVMSVITGQIREAMTQAMEQVMNQVVRQIRRTMTRAMTEMSEQIQEAVTDMFTEIMLSMEDAMNFDPDLIAEAFQINMAEENVLDLMMSIMNPNISTYEKNLTALGYADLSVPSQINIYPRNFEAKQSILDILADYNRRMEENDTPEKVIRFLDIVGVMMSSVTEIIDLVSYGLIAFVSISLVVSSIMIGVITFISVLERKKEIGILRAIGASKQNIRTVFNAEALIIGFVAGVLGVLITLLIVFFGNMILYNRFDLENLASLPVAAGLALVGVSMFLTFIAGLFPSSAAARKDPVEALRSE